MPPRAHRPRLLLLHYTAPPVVGGVERVIAEQARCLAAHGYDVTLLAGQGEAAANPGAELVLVPELRAAAAQDRAQAPPSADHAAAATLPARAAALADRLRPFFATHQHAIVHNVLSMHFNLPLTSALRRIAEEESTAAPILAWCHDATSLNPSYARLPLDRPPFDLLRRPVRRARYVTPTRHRQGQIARLLEIPPETVAVVPNGFDFAAFHRAGATPPRPSPGATLRILCPVRILPRKNLELAIDVVAALIAQGHPAALTISGPVDPHQPQLQAYADSLRHRAAQQGCAAAVAFAGSTRAIPYDAMPRLYAASDLVLLTSHQEGFGLPLLEAAAARRPVACPDAEPFREVAGPYPIYFHPGAAAADIARALVARRLHVDLDRAAARARAFDWAVIGRDRLLPLLEGAQRRGESA